MVRLKTITNQEADTKALGLLDGIQKKLGKTPNMMRIMANSPTVLEAYLGFSSTLGKGSLPAKLREQIALTVGEANQCGYCLAAHSALGRMAGLSDEDIADSRRGTSPDRKTEAALVFAQKVVKDRGFVADEDIESLRNVGFDDGAITEIVANVALNLFTNYFNHITDAEVDFPEAKELAFDTSSSV